VSASTTDYYNVNAEQFIGDTLSADMQVLYQPFLALLPTHAHILDAGYGSGRDSLAFLQMGYQVSAFDASEKMAAHISQTLGAPVSVRNFQPDVFICSERIFRHKAVPILVAMG
jgi:SAM-dependent methyltransferase